VLNSSLFSSKKDDWETPDDLFNLYNRTFRFGLDAAANQTNHKVDTWFGPGGVEEDALAAPDWMKWGNVWLNPPYTRGVQEAFIERAASEGLKHLGAVVCLLPARTDTKLFHNVIKYGQVEFLRGRVKFKGAKHGAPFPSLIAVFR